MFEAEDDDTRHYLLAPERLDLKVEKKLEDVELLRRHLGCFHVLAIVNSTALNVRVHNSFQSMVFSGYIPRGSIAVSYGSSVFSFLRALRTALHGGYINLHSHQQCRRFLFLHILSRINYL